MRRKSAMADINTDKLKDLYALLATPPYASQVKKIEEKINKLKALQ